MKNSILILLLFISCTSYAQFVEGQGFCIASEDKSYFPLGLNEKKIFWADTHYTETKLGTQEIEGKIYVTFQQKWKNNATDALYLREENGVVYQYEDCCETETVRFNPNFKVGHVWKTADGMGTYEVITYDGKFKTPFCNYENLMVIKATLQGGTFEFYYQRGHGYVGASVNNQIISCVTPTLEMD
ncbi:MAG: hypothetical protein Aureis2KO_08690 [Aureisphaera sp.]